MQGTVDLVTNISLISIRYYYKDIRSTRTTRSNQKIRNDLQGSSERESFTTVAIDIFRALSCRHLSMYHINTT